MTLLLTFIDFFDSFPLSKFSNSYLILSSVSVFLCRQHMVTHYRLTVVKAVRLHYSYVSRSIYAHGHVIVYGYRTWTSGTVYN